VEAELIAKAESEIIEMVGWTGDDDAADFRPLVEEFNGPHEQGPAAQVLVEFVAAAEAFASARGSDNHGYVHSDRV
jgi:hypothetical protein